jgi:predicted DNA-binding transcriptional regulator YafY
MAESAARLLQLLSLLTSRPQWAAAELAERLEVTDRTLRRDIERLRALGYPVHSARGVAGGYRLGAGSALPPLLLDDEEATAVVIALRTAAIGGVTGIAETAVSALAKLEQVLPARLRHRIASLQRATVLLPRAAAMADSQTLALIAAACYHQRRMRFAYTDYHDQASTRSVEPYRLVHSGRYWYLVANDLDRAAWRVFRVDRITDPHDTAVRFIPHDPPDAAEFVAASVSTAQYPCRAKVRLHVSVEDAAQRFPPSTGVLEVTGPDQCVLTTGAYSLDDIAMHLGVLDIEFTVLEPAELRSRVEAIADRFHRAAQRDADGVAVAAVEAAADGHRADAPGAGRVTPVRSENS